MNNAESDAAAAAKKGPKHKASQEALEALSKRFDQLAESLNKPAIGDANQLLTRINQLEKLVLRMAHNSGTAHAIIRQSDLVPFNPLKADMSKFHKAG